MIFFKNAWPVESSRAALALEVVLVVTKGKPEWQHIRKRCQDAKECPRVITEIVRVFNLLCFTPPVTGGYDFAALAASPMIVRLAVLLAKDRDLSPESSPGVFDIKRPYTHQAIAAAIRAQFFMPGPKNFAVLYADDEGFKSKDPRFPDRKEMPDSIVALAATAIKCIFDEHQTGTRVTIGFAGNTYAETYRRHMRALVDLRAKAPQRTAQNMSDLYDAVINPVNEESRDIDVNDYFDVADSPQRPTAATSSAAAASGSGSVDAA
ncbi:hypothetical protein C8F01DRAFT_1173679 [Mycena amicta]|nr:hypothetical protein C8F01DRAFT_1173679 [Mycena amicta]